MPLFMILFLLCSIGGSSFRLRRGMMQMNTRSLTEVLGTFGDYVTINLEIRDKGHLIPTDFDQGEIKLIIGSYAGFHPIVHEMSSRLPKSSGSELVETKNGGPYYQEAVLEIPQANAPAGLKVGDIVKLSNGLKARVTRSDETSLVIDANAPLAGKDLEWRIKLLERKDRDSLAPACFACGCFWGLQLALDRVPGVIYTCAGYTQGRALSPAYEDVCTGTTGHAEAVFVLFDPSIVSYKELLTLYFSRHDPTQLNRQGNDVGTQYRGGVYFTSDDQKADILAAIKFEQQKYKQPIVTEVIPHDTFWVAEPVHQGYLERESLQSAKKSDPTPIRCYG